VEVFCRQCQFWKDRPRGKSKLSICPRCGAPIATRVRPSPSPGTHYRLVFNSILSMRGVLFVIMFGICLLLGQLLWIMQTLAYVLLFVGAVRLAWRAMSITGGELEFPEVAVDDTVVNVFVFSFIFIGVPLALLGLSIGQGPVPAGAGVPISLLLLAYAPLALVLMLKSNSVVGMLDLPTAIRVIRHDPGGYFFIGLMVLGSFGLTFLLTTIWDAARFPASIAAYLLVVPGLGFTVPFAFGLCGLYVRSKARLFQVACDEEEWTRAPIVAAAGAPGTSAAPTTGPAAAPISVPPIAQAPIAPQQVAPPPVAQQPLAPPPVSGPALGAIPLVAGQLLSDQDEPPLVQGVLEVAPPTATSPSSPPLGATAAPPGVAAPAGASPPAPPLVVPPIAPAPPPAATAPPPPPSGAPPLSASPVAPAQVAPQPIAPQPVAPQPVAPPGSPPLGATPRPSTDHAAVGTTPGAKGPAGGGSDRGQG